MKNRAAPPLAFIQGLDGSGKSTAAKSSALELSAANPNAMIAVTDSTGLYKFKGGWQVRHWARNLDELEPKHSDSMPKTALKLGAFSIARRFINSPRLIGDADLLISVRDPHRIDPAAYAKVYGGHILAALPSELRLKFFDAVTNVPYADSIVRLNSTVNQISSTIPGRNQALGTHETAESLAMMADELPIVIEAYRRMYGSGLHEVEALTPTTTQDVSAALEPLLRGSSATIVAPGWSQEPSRLAS